jgi:hypothetical protein
VTTLFDDKRQAPYAYTPSGGSSQNWSAHDTDVAAMSLETIPFITGSSSSGINSIVSQINAVIDQINVQVNTYVVTPGINLANETDSLQNNLNALPIQFLNVYCQSDLDPHGSHAAPGVPRGGGNCPNSAISFGPGVPSGIAISHIGVPGAGSNIPWSPIGATAPINITMADMTSIMTGISVRRQSLLNTRNTKNSAIAALATIAAAIAYDVTAGW